MENLFLYQKLEVYKDNQELSKLPDMIEENLASNIELRDYQIDAFRFFITNYEKKSNTKQIHNLFHMATGSGKTVIMAGLILYLYSKGYRNFLFFVNQTNILEKTKNNFSNPISTKYLFKENLQYLGENITINIVNSFQSSVENAINICFTTTQRLHSDLNNIKENSLTIEDFEDDRIVLISDESHHLNSGTKKNETKTLQLERETWEYSISKIFRSNFKNILLEFTATCDLNNKNITDKYMDKIVFNYPLLNFRESGFTKDFANYQSNTEMFERSLRALIFSEYRSYLFADLNLNIKPVILMKSAKIKESKLFYQEFHKRLKNLSSYDLLNLYKMEQKNSSENHAFLDSLKYFYKKDNSFEVLEHSLKDSFSEEKSLLIDNKNITPEKQIYLNSLEDKNNYYRIIFAVDMLNEGWDVLNLFDIVRLYDTRQASGEAGKIGKYTMQEAQLIGRGARYCPFIAKNGQEKFKRKYDYDDTNKYRILEKILYHCQNDSKYITELTSALIATGFVAEKKYRIDYKLKSKFKESDIYQKGLIYSNKRIPKGRTNINSMEGRIRNSTFSYEARTGEGKISEFFGETNKAHNLVHSNYSTTKLKHIDYNIVLGASEKFDNLQFNVIKLKYPNLNSFSEFINSDKYLGNVLVEIKTSAGEIKSKDFYNACFKMFYQISNYIGSIKQEFEGSKIFEPIQLKKVVKDKSIYLSSINKNGGQGTSQIQTSSTVYQLDLDQEDWYVYNDNYGTSEEKLFIKYFKTNIKPKLDKMNLEYYVIRNERVPELAIYSFDHGERFEPDYILLVKHVNIDSSLNYQIYAEPKGSHLLLKDKWKEDFLLDLKDTAKVSPYFNSGNSYKIFGLPFYNDRERRIQIDSAIEDWIANEF